MFLSYIYDVFHCDTFWMIQRHYLRFSIKNAIEILTHLMLLFLACFVSKLISLVYMSYLTHESKNHGSISRSPRCNGWLPSQEKKWDYLSSFSLANHDTFSIDYHRPSCYNRVSINIRAITCVNRRSERQAYILMTSHARAIMMPR